MINQLQYLSRYFTSKAIGLYILLLAACFFLFPGHGLPLMWVGFGLIEVVTFFYFSSSLTRKWADLSGKRFERKLFWTAFLIRLVYVVAIYFFYQYMTGEPFEFSAADSKGYHNEAIWLVDLFKSHRMGTYFEYIPKASYSDIGFPVYLAVFYFILGPIVLVPRLVNAFLGAWMCMGIYKLSQRNFGEDAAKMTAIWAMLLPNLIYYCGLHTKEILMLFLTMAFIEKADYLVRQKRFFFHIFITIVLLGCSVFFLRTVLAVSLWFALISAVVFSHKRIVGWNKRIVIGIWLMAAISMIYFSDLSGEVEIYIKQIDTNQKLQMEHFATREGANKFATYGKVGLFLPIIITAPFPTMVNINGQDNSMMMNGGIFTRNVYSFFVFLAFFLLIKRKMIREHLLILVYLLTSLGIMAISGFALSERFHLIIVPCLLILAGYGVTQADNKSKKYYGPYLVLIFFLIIGWNWFKLAGRGLIT